MSTLKPTIGVILRDPQSATEKFYSIVLTSEGEIVTSHGQGQLSRYAARARMTEQIRSTQSKAGMVKVFNNRVLTKRKRGYTQVEIPMVNFSTSGVVASDIMADFLKSTGFKKVENAKRWIKENEVISNFVDAASSGKETFRMSGPEVVLLRHNSTMRNADKENGNSTPAVKDTSAKTNSVKSSVDTIEKGLAGLRISGALIRPNGESYTPRSVGAHHDVALLRHLYKSNIAVRLPGPPGAGKTALIEAAFPGAITVAGHGDMTIDDFVGTDRPDTKSPGAWVWIDGPLTTAMKTGNVLYVDEITRVPQEVLAILYSVMDGRNVLRLDRRPDLPPVKAQEGFGVIAAYNPDVFGARPLDEALMSRFKVAIEVRTDFDTAKVLKVPAKFITVARNMATRDKKDRENDGPGLWVPQMRELLAARDLINAGVGEDIAIGTLLGACPDVDTLPVLIQVASNVFGTDVKLLALGKSV